MGQPKLNIVFKEQAATFNRRSGMGIVACILQDASTADQGFKKLMSSADVSNTLSAANQTYLKNIFIGNVTRPRMVLLYVLDDEAAAYTDAFAELAKHHFDWLVAAPDVNSTLATAVQTWVTTQRSDYGQFYKAVLPSTEADSEAIVNFEASGIIVGDTTYTGAAYCSRIAGILAGTPLKQSSTYAVLPEVSDITRLTISAADTAANAGKLVLLHDGIKVKLGRAVTSLTTTTTTSAQLKKIKIMQIVDLIKYDLHILLEDNYIGQYQNDYDGKCLLVTAVLDYLKTLESDSILADGSTVGIDVDAQRAYLVQQGVDVSGMTEKQIKEYNTGSKAFLKASVKILDAIEDIDIDIIF